MNLFWNKGRNIELIRSDIDLDRYELLPKTGSSPIYLARDKTTGAKRAIKITDLYAIEDLDDLTRHRDLTLRAENEIKQHSRIDKKDLTNIVDIIEGGVVTYDPGFQSVYVLVMEYIEGQTLRELINKRSISSAQALDYAKQCFEGIMTIEKYGLKHQDIRPENLMVNNDGVLKIIDFGIATDDMEATQVDARRYGSPIGKKSRDTFPLGLILYEMNSGEHLARDDENFPYEGLQIEHVKRIKNEMFNYGDLRSEYIERIKSKTHPALHDIIIACLQCPHDIESIRKAFEIGIKEMKGLPVDSAEKEALRHSVYPQKIEYDSKFSESERTFLSRRNIPAKLANKFTKLGAEYIYEAIQMFADTIDPVVGILSMGFDVKINNIVLKDELIAKINEYPLGMGPRDICECIEYHIGASDIKKYEPNTEEYNAYLKNLIDRRIREKYG